MRVLQGQSESTTAPSSSPQAESAHPQQQQIIKVTRNLRAHTVKPMAEPVEYPESGVLYTFDVADWKHKMAFYDNVAYSFGVPSTQKHVFCYFLGIQVMHYERTCQGVYYCPFLDNNPAASSSSATAASVSSCEECKCTVKPCRFRFNTCECHKGTPLKKSGPCALKIHLYVPLEPSDSRRLLLCLGEHSHAHLTPQTPVSPASCAPSPLRDDNSNSVAGNNNSVPVVSVPQQHQQQPPPPRKRTRRSSAMLSPSPVPKKKTRTKKVSSASSRSDSFRPVQDAIPRQPAHSANDLLPHVSSFILPQECLPQPSLRYSSVPTFLSSSSEEQKNESPIGLHGISKISCCKPETIPWNQISAAKDQNVLTLPSISVLLRACELLD